MKNLPTVTIAASAFNEESNLIIFLNSLLTQNESGFKLDKILIISDGSTDKTVKLARMLKSDKIEIREYKKRAGKSTRLNEIYRGLKSDILIQTDCDVIFSRPNVVSEMVKALMSNSSVGMAGGNTIPLPASNFLEKAINYTHASYAALRYKVRGRNNMFSVDGRILGFKKELVKKIKVPSTMITNDIYTYFCCIANGYDYRFAYKSLVRFKSPQNFEDHTHQNLRYLAAKQRMKRYFDPELVDREFSIPKMLLLRYTFIQFIKNPVLCLYIFVLNRYYALIKVPKKEHNLNAKWRIATSTKQLFG